jgi:hypothetical protein
MTQKLKIAGWMAGAGAGLAMAAGGVLTRPAALLLGLLPRRYGHYLLGGELVPLHSRLLGIYAGLALALLCGFALWYRYLCCRPDFAFLKTGRGKFLFVILVVLALLTLSLSVNRVFWDDEIEHIHASWYVQNGQMPYRDFFEHHHPLFWFLLAPLIALCGEGLLVLAISRLLILLMAVGIGWLTWRISRLAGGNAETAWLAMVILFSNFLFIPCVMEIRPDIPMVFLALAAVERLLLFMKEGKSQQLLAAAFLAALSFLFLQKVIFLFPAAMVLLCAWRLTGKIGAGLFWKTIGVFLLPLLLFAVWLVFSGMFRDYFLCNWLLNVKRQGVFSLWLVIGRMALVNIVFWLSLLPALAHALRSEKSSAAMKVVALFGFTALAALFLLPNPADRHFLLSLPLLSVMVGGWAGDRSHFSFRGRLHKIYLAGLLVVPLPFLTALGFPLNGVQLEKFAYVLRLTAPADRVLDGRNDFNLFRPDLHYFWFQIDPGEMLDNYRRVHGGSHSSYDVCRLIREQKPRFIFLNRREWTACGVSRKYVPTPYAGLLFCGMATTQADEE